jgi:hypothetical protein
MTLEEDIKALKPNLSDNSIKTYSSLLRHLFITLEIDEPINPSSIASYYKPIIFWVSSLNPKKRKSICSACLAFVDGTNTIAEQTFRQVVSSAFKEENKQEEDQELTRRQKDAYMSWVDIIARRDEMSKQISWLRPVREQIQDYVILCVYTYNPPRRCLDYCLMVNPSEVKSNVDDQVNYIDFESKVFIFNRYKTSKTYETQVVPIHDKLLDILQRWVNINHSKWLFHTNTLKPLTPDTMTKRLAKIMQKPGFGVNILRHAYVNDVVLSTTPFINNIKDAAHDLGHSYKETMLYKKH